jgi:ribonuclease PH
MVGATPSPETIGVGEIMRTERAANALRHVEVVPGFSPFMPSVIYKVGKTIVQCTASVDEKVPGFVKEGSGWLTAEYAMLPGATMTRARRDRGGKIGGRTLEIQRLIGRSLRSIVDLEALGPRAIFLDCDVLSADGGTRCASISGAFLALTLLLHKLEGQGLVKVDDVLQNELAAISVGIVEGELLLDLEYKEDSRADVDFNLVMTADGRFIEIQGTAERNPFTPDQLQQLLAIGEKGIREQIELGRDFITAQAKQ